MLLLHLHLAERAGRHDPRFPKGHSQPAHLHQRGWGGPRHSWMQPGGALRPAYQWDRPAAGQRTCQSARQPVFSGRLERGAGGTQRAHQRISGGADCESHRSGPRYEPRRVSWKGESTALCSFLFCAPSVFLPFILLWLQISEIQKQAVLKSRIQESCEMAKRSVYSASSIQLLCRNCFKPVASGSDIKLIESVHHVNVNPDFQWVEPLWEREFIQMHIHAPVFTLHLHCSNLVSVLRRHYKVGGQMMLPKSFEDWEPGRIISCNNGKCNQVCWTFCQILIRDSDKETFLL